LQFVPLIAVEPHVARSTIASGGGVIPGLNIHCYEPCPGDRPHPID
jgi:hypothetical protein